MNDYLMIAEVPFASLQLVMQIVGGFTAIKAIMETRTAQGAIAWTLALLLLPWIALPAYWVFGPKKFAGYVTLRQAKKIKASAIARQLANEFERIRMKNASGRKEENFLERLAGLPFTIGNRVELLINGAETFAAIFAAIAEAKDYVLMQFYLIHDDELGKKLRDALIDRAKSGVRCLVLFDEIGSGRLPHFTKELRANGVKIFPFNSTKGLINRWQINFRNHRKIVIVDGRKSFVGGHN
ncbi:MAG: phospholipase D-like domain-containing protein, partial [Verrucomicrobia bacterium]|nr:phospholipase D-like domain-containing protein [Verrucomicrobiota bacterium]